jgi:hypothetical protein
MSRKEIEEESGMKSNTADSNAQYYDEAEEDSGPARGKGSGLGCFILPGLQELRRICNSAADDEGADGTQNEPVRDMSAGSQGGVGGRDQESDSPGSGSAPCSTLPSTVQSEIFSQAMTTSSDLTTVVEVKIEEDAGECELFDSSDEEDLVPKRQRELNKSDWDIVDTQLSEHISAFYEQGKEYAHEDGDAEGTFLSVSSNGQIQVIAPAAISITTRHPLPLSSDKARACTAEIAPGTVHQQSPNKISEGTSKLSSKKWVVPSKTEKENKVARDAGNLQRSQSGSSAGLEKGPNVQKNLSIGRNSNSSSGSGNTSNPHAMYIPPVKVLHSKVIARAVPPQPPKQTAESLLRRSGKLQVTCQQHNQILCGGSMRGRTVALAAPILQQFLFYCCTVCHHATT